MRTVVPLDRFSVDQADKGLVDECRRLEAMSHALSGHAATRDPVELLVDERNQSLEGARIALAPFEQQCGDSGGVFRNATILDPLLEIRAYILRVLGMVHDLLR
jgi:hypothetical protein